MGRNAHAYIIPRINKNGSVYNVGYFLSELLRRLASSRMELTTRSLSDWLTCSYYGV